MLRLRANVNDKVTKHYSHFHIEKGMSLPLDHKFNEVSDMIWSSGLKGFLTLPLKIVPGHESEAHDF